MPKTELEKNIDFLLSAALRKCGSLEDAKDLAQETLLSALTFLSKGGIIEDTKAWLLTILNRRFYDMLRRKYSKPTISCDTIFDIPDNDDALDAIIRSEEAEKIRREIAYLSRLYRDVIIRRYMKNRSVEEIAEELVIPVGTVKSRLSGGREQIRKGFDTMESYAKQSYEPEKLHVTCSGRSGLDDEPYSLVNDDLTVQNILISAYNEPVMESELSKAIGIPTAYIEPIVQKLIDNELMKRTGNKVYTDFIIFTNDDVTKSVPAQKELVNKDFQNIWQPVSKGFDKLHKTVYFKRMNNRQQNKLKYYFLMKCLEMGIYNTGSRIFNGVQNFPERPNGGKWIAFGYRNTENNDHSYSYSGERWDSYDNYAGSKLICIHVYDTPLEKQHYYSGKYGMIEDCDILKLLYVINENINPNDVGLNLMLLESIPHLTECGVLKIDGDKTWVDIPVLTSVEFYEMIDLCNTAVAEITDNITDALAEHLKNAKTEIPKHLKSVPEQKQYMQSTGCIHMMTVYEAIRQGLIGQDIDYPCPPMMMVIDK